MCLETFENSLFSSLTSLHSTGPGNLINLMV